MVESIINPIMIAKKENKNITLQKSILVSKVHVLQENENNAHSRVSREVNLLIKEHYC